MRAALTAADRFAARVFAALGRFRLLGPVVILLVAAAAVLPGQRALPVIDRDEARFVQASRQMLESRNFIDPRNQEAPRYQKPVGLYWAQVGAAALDGREATAPIHVFRTVSVAGIALAALFTWWGFLPVLGPAGAALAGVMVATATVSIGEAHIAKTDALLLGVTTAALAALVRVWLAAREGRRHWARWLFWVALALGVLIKGPITPLLAAFVVAGLSLRDRRPALVKALSPLPGLALFGVLTLPWFVTIGVVSDGAFYAQSFGRDLMDKVGQGAEGHAGPPGYYLATVWISFWPWVPFAALALAQAWRDRTGDLPILALAWIVPFWLVFEATSTKLPHYILPTLPAVAALAAAAILRPEPQHAAVRIIAALLLALGASVLTALIVAGPLFVGERPDMLSVPLAALGLSLALVAAAALALRLRPAAWLLALGAALVLMPTFVARTLPGLPVLFPSQRMAALDARFDACADRPAASLGYAEMSLVVLAGTDTRFPDIAAAAALLAANDGGRVFVTEAGDELRAPLAASLGAEPRELARFDTINYNQSDRRLATRLLAHPDDTILAPCAPDP